jgi:internalin A
VADRVHRTWTEKADTAVLRLEYRFFHPAIIRNLMRRIGQEAGELAEYWKYGIWFHDGKRDTQILVQFEDTSTDAAPGAGALELKAQGRDPLGLLREIRRSLPWQRDGERPEETLTYQGATVTRSALGSAVDGWVLDTHKVKVDAAPFAAFFEDRDLRPEDGPAKEPGIDILPTPPPPDSRREVFISYAWGDDTPPGKVRTQVVDALYQALEKEDGFRPVRDRDQMKSGDRISAFIRRLTQADLVVAVISEKYLHSPYCMFEIYKLWQRCQADPEELGKSLVPIVLPEVAIGTFEDRVPYMAHWSERAEQLEAMIRNPKIRPSRESWEEVRLIRAFADDIDGILVFLQDVLMPRQLEAHLDQGFPAVLEALRRRIDANE